MSVISSNLKGGECNLPLQIYKKKIELSKYHKVIHHGSICFVEQIKEDHCNHSNIQDIPEFQSSKPKRSWKLQMTSLHSS